MKKKLFRKTALENLSSPEQLDQLVMVTGPATWLTLAVVVMLIVVVVLWGIFGTVDTSVQGQGMLLRGGGIFHIDASGSGRLVELNVSPRDFVKAGQVVGRISQKDLKFRLENSREKLKLLKQRRENGEDVDKEQLKLYYQFLEEKQVGLEKSIAATKERSYVLGGRIKVTKEVFEQGLVSQQMLMRMVADFNNNEQALGIHESDLKQMLVDKMKYEENMEREQFSEEANIEELENSIELLFHDLKMKSEIISPYDGRVVEVKEDVGSLISFGQPVISVEPFDEELIAFIYVSTTEGKKIVPSMKVSVFPSAVNKEEYGYLYGIVQSVSLFPATYNGMMRVLENENLVKRLSQTGAPFAVIVKLIADDTVSGFRWSSKKGPPVQIDIGTFCDVKIIVRQDRPISLVIPFFKKCVGIY